MTVCPYCRRASHGKPLLEWRRDSATEQVLLLDGAEVARLDRDTHWRGWHVTVGGIARQPPLPIRAAKAWAEALVGEKR